MVGMLHSNFFWEEVVNKKNIKNKGVNTEELKLFPGNV